MKKMIKKIWSVVPRLHLGLYFLFMVMVAAGSSTAFLFENYSRVDMGLLKTEWQHVLSSQAKGGSYFPTTDVIVSIFRPLKVTKHINYVIVDGKTEKREMYTSGTWLSDLYFLFLVIWLMPLYLYYFSKKKRSLARVERRIVNLPVFIFLLSWVLAIQHYFASAAAYAAQFGAAPRSVKVVFAVSSLLLGTFVSYLNLELTGLYIRRYLARPFFMAHDPYGIKRGFAINLTLRYALMIFSLAMVPLLLTVYVPVYANLDIFVKMATDGGKDPLWALSIENLRVLLPLLIVTGLVGAMLVFQVVSILLYRYNVQAPVSALVRRMKAVAAGDFNCKTSVLYADEFGQLKGHFNLMLDGLVERDKIKDTFGRYVSLEIAEKIMKSGRVNLAGEEIQATVLFSDIRGFTPMSEGLPPVELIRFLNEYFAYITKPIADNKGVINKFIGDAVMAIFSPVFGVEDHQAAGLRAALGMREALQAFNAQKRHPEVLFGVGLHSGGLVAGNVGTEARLEYTVLGDTVNVASRIESQTKDAATQILVSEALVNGVDENRFPGFAFIECAPVLMKGKSRPMTLYKVEPV